MKDTDQDAPSSAAPELLTRMQDLDEGGDPVCWLDKVCPTCGLFTGDHRSTTCPRCGDGLPD